MRREIGRGTKNCTVCCRRRRARGGENKRERVIRLQKLTSNNCCFLIFNHCGGPLARLCSSKWPQMHHPSPFIHHFFSRSSIPPRKNSEENFNKLPSAVRVFFAERFGGIINCHRESVRKSDIFALSQIALGKTVCRGKWSGADAFFFTFGTK